MTNSFTKREALNIHIAMRLAQDASRYSKCERSKVGAVMITPDEAFFLGINGSLPNACNCCEEEIDGVLVTKPDIIHAEANALDKSHKVGVTAKDAIFVQTLSPCAHCITRMRNVGVKAIVFLEKYRITEHLVQHLESGYTIPYEEFCKEYPDGKTVL